MSTPFVHLHIDTQANTAQLADSAPHTFHRRWEAAVLALLLHAGGVPVSAMQISSALAARGQRQPLNRAQFQRLFDALAAFAALLPPGVLRVQALPRQWSVGPWQAHCAQSLQVVVDGQALASPQPAHTHWPHPAITQDADTHALHEVLQQLLVADAFAQEGQWLQALQQLHELLAHDVAARLTPEGLSVLQLRQATALRRLGRHGQAIELTQQVAQRPAPADPGAADYARFLLQRTGYDQAPALTHAALWHETAHPPAHQQGDARTLAEWHNLRALLARRRMLGPPPPDADEPAHLHTLALRHLQAAIYLSLWHADWSRLQAYVANLAFHLQAWGTQNGWPQGVSVLDVLKWQRLCLAYSDKFDAGRDSAWEYIFFARFWLDNRAQLASASLHDLLGLRVDSLLPDDERFYTTAVQRLRVLGEPRPLAIMLVLWLRFVREHRHCTPAAHCAIEDELLALLQAQPPAFARALREEGYGAWLPGAKPARRWPTR